VISGRAHDEALVRSGVVGGGGGGGVTTPPSGNSCLAAGSISVLKVLGFVVENEDTCVQLILITNVEPLKAS
jgi:hypothetical protein